MTAANHETVLATIREHGPLTKTEIASRLYGNSGGAGRVEKVLDELKQLKCITLTAGKTKSGHKRRAWVYMVSI